MLTICVQRTLDFPADTVWAVLADFGNIGWAAGDNKVEVIGEGIGTIRRIIVEGLEEPIDEVLDALDADAKRLAYSIPRGMPFPVENYAANATVQANGDTQCEVTWRGQFTAKPEIADEDAKTLMESTYRQLIDWLTAHLETTT